MNCFWLYEKNREFDKQQKTRIDFIKSQKSELDGIERGLCDWILRVNKDNLLQVNQDLGSKINKLNRGSTKNSLYQWYGRNKFKDFYAGYFSRKSIHICTYCGCENLFCGEGLATSTELDHYLDRDKYPQYAGSPYNIIPVCRNCNNAKKNNNIDVGSNDISNFYPSTRYPISGLYLVNEWEECNFATDFPILFNSCKIQNKFSANRNQSKLQVIYEKVQEEAVYYGTDIIKTTFRRKEEKKLQLWDEPYAHFDSQFYEWLLNNNGFKN